MNRIVSFHPVDMAFFDETVAPLIAGKTINPEPVLSRALHVRRHLHQTRGYLATLEDLWIQAQPPREEPESGLVGRFKAKLARFDHKVEPLALKVREKVEADAVLHGRPFLVTEATPRAVAERVTDYLDAPEADDVTALVMEQLIRLDAEIARGVKPAEIGELSADLTYRNDLLAWMKEIYDVAHAVRRGERGAQQKLEQEIPWRAVKVHAATIPFWIGWEVDGLDSVCRAAGLDPPTCLGPPWRLFTEACGEFPGIRDKLTADLGSDRDVGAFVPPDEIPDMIAFLQKEGARIIRVATQHGEGPRCSMLLRKIRETATFAQQHGLGYLEASGILPPDQVEED